MFCNKCGAQLPDGTRFCGQCGNSFEQQPEVQQPQQPVYQQPQQPVYQQPVYQQPVTQQPNMTRDQFVDKTQGKKGLLLRGMLAACALLVIIGLCVTLWGSFLENPSFKTIMGSEMNDLEEDLEDALDELEARSEYGMLTDEEEEVAEVLEKFLETPSLMNMTKFLNMFGEEKYQEALGASSDDAEAFAMLSGVINGVITGLVISFLLGLLFTALACWKRNTVLIVFAALFSVGNCFSALGTLLGLVMLALYIASIVVNVQLSKQYKAYQNGQNAFA